MKVMLSGSSGFVGSHVLRHMLMQTDAELVCPFSFRHKGLPARVASAICGDASWARRVEMVHWDMRAPADTMTVKAFEGCDVFMNVASESHVDRSIAEPVDFIQNNVSLMLNVLELARVIKPRLFLHMSTDEVYGPAYGDHLHSEWETILPSNPYSASKAAQEAVGMSYWRTYGVPLVLTNTMNVVGELMSTEKFLPMIIRNLLHDLPITVHCSPEGVPGSRFYLHARNLADAWLFLTKALDPPAMYADGSSRPDRFHIVGEEELDNVSLVEMIAGIMGKEPRIERVSFHQSRPGHDLRYALDGKKIEALGWRPPVPLYKSLEKTVEWTLAHDDWLTI